ncbi:MAG: putative beta-ketoacyl synthase [Streblomastix strix]|uniref:Putative beta-ketoacyl synthase n=1 Tax=Streblomastix strix TaxID=222440 RepID=A0A5J4UCG5_9EUKA|nr:MAG: putative beta-ketoacyl synthase [Streblomastix strix]
MRASNEKRLFQCLDLVGQMLDVLIRNLTENQICMIVFKEKYRLVNVLRFWLCLDYPSSAAFEHITYTLACHRTAHDQARFACVARNKKDAIEHLRQVASSSSTEGVNKSSSDEQSGVSNPDHYIRTTQSERKRVLIVVFSGQGPQWWGMGRSLYKTNYIFSDIINKICELFQQIYPSINIINEMFIDKNISKIGETFALMPIFFAIQVSLFEVLKSAGVIPSQIVGHSLGEIATSYCSGALSLADAVLVCYTRSRMQYSVTGKGFMAAVKMDMIKLQALLKKAQ